MGTPHTVHEWREKTADGDTRFNRAWRGLGKWRFSTTLKSEESWTELTPPDAGFLNHLHEILTNKYQRRRVPWEHITEIEKMLAAGKE